MIKSNLKSRLTAFVLVLAVVFMYMPQQAEVAHAKGALKVMPVTDEYNIPEGKTGEKLGKTKSFFDLLEEFDEPFFEIKQGEGPSWLRIRQDGYLEGTRPSTPQAETTCIVTIYEDGQEEATSEKVTIKVGAVTAGSEKPKHELVPVTHNFKENISITYGDTLAAQEVRCTTGGTVEYSSTNPDVVQVNDKNLSIAVPVGVGEADVVAKVAESETHAEANMKYHVTVSKKSVNISGLKVKDRAYDRTNIVELDKSDAKLEGVLDFEKDKVSVDMPMQGKVADANAGQNKSVMVVKPVLNGERAGNYELVDITGLTVNITKATCTGTPAITKITEIGKTLKDANIQVGSIQPAGGTISFDSSLDTAVEKGVPYGWTYTPADATNYEVLKGRIIVCENIQPKTPILKVEPITVPYSGKAVTADKIKGTAKVDGTDVDGAFRWKDAAPVTVADSGNKIVVFTPNDEALYTTAEANVQVTINKAKVTVTDVKKSAPEKVTTKTALGDIKLLGKTNPENVKGKLELASGQNLKEGKHSYNWVFAPEDKENYEGDVSTDANKIEIEVAKVETGGSGGGGSSKPSSSSSKPAEQPKKNEQTVPEQVAKAETVKVVKELVKNIADKEQAKQVDKLVENKPVTEKKAAIKALTVETKTKLAEAVLPKYTDVKKDNWYAKDLAVVMSLGLVKGTSESKVSPEKNVTGKEMMTMLVRSMGKEVKQAADPNWYDSYKKEATNLKLDAGIKFDVSKDLSRAEVAAMMYNYVKLNEKTAEKVDTNALAMVKDMADIPAEYKEAVAYMYQKGLLKGYEDGSFKPNQNLSRAEVASILARLLAM